MSASSNVTLTIICVTAYDSIRFAKTLDSVKGIKGDLEFVVVCPKDDHSSIKLIGDASIEMDYQIKTIHDSGAGIYQAMNLGLQNCLGKYVIFWNSGDLSLGDSTLLDLLFFMEKSDADWGVAQGKFSWRKEISLTHQNILDFVMQSDGYLSHQTVFAKKTCLKELGGFNETYKVSADTDLITKLFVRYGNPVFFDSSIVEVEFPEYSGRHHRRGRYENMIICIKVLPFEFKFRAFGNSLKKEFGYMRSRLFSNLPKL